MRPVRCWTGGCGALLELDDRRFASALEVQRRDEMSYDPGTPPITATELRLLAAHDRTEGNRHERFAIVDGARTRALVHLELETDKSNAHHASMEVFGAAADPEAGRVAVAAALDRVESEGRSVLTGWGPLDHEADFWTGLGAVLRYRERVSTLDVIAVDREMMATWIERRTDRAADVELVRWIGRCPDEHLDAWIVSRTAMNDAPTDDLDINTWKIDADDIREDEASREALGTRFMNLFAIDTVGDAVGHTMIHVNPYRPPASWQWDTVVLAHHRRRGIGRWLKAEMWRWLRDAEPEVTRLATGNAMSNDPMLAINAGMGFAGLAVFGAWQAPVATYRAAGLVRPAPRSSG